MKRVLIAAGAVLLLAAPAFAQSPVTIETGNGSTTIKTNPATTSGSTVSTVTVAPTAPPELRTEVKPAAPGPNFVWTPGHWRWDPVGASYVWMAGKYVEAPRAQASWIPGRWVQTPTGWVWEEGRWQ